MACKKARKKVTEEIERAKADSPWGKKKGQSPSIEKTNGGVGKPKES